MFSKIRTYLTRVFQGRRYSDIDPDDIFMDSKNLPAFDVHQFEGRLEKPIPVRTFLVFGSVCLLICLIFLYRSWDLQIAQGAVYAEKSQNNSLDKKVIHSSRGIIYDRNGEELAWNASSISDDTFAERQYINLPGFGHLLGFVKYPAKDSSGFYYRENYDPQDGLELFLDSELRGENGSKITETDVSGQVISQSLVQRQEDGEAVNLSVDSRIQTKLYEKIAELADNAGFEGGSGVIMDVNTGEIIAMTSYPEYEPAVMASGSPAETIQDYYENANMPFLDRAISGLYAPGSIVKPFMAFAALEENIISPEKQIVSTGKLVIPNPYFPDKPSIFLDWKAHGAVDMRHAIAVSSDVYFYEIGGGFQDQKGLGIANIKEYLEKFGFGQTTGLGIPKESVGLIPDPAWKEKTFGENWLLGDTYHTVIGQYGMQVTPMQVARGISAVANKGTLVTPTFIKQATSTSPIGEKIGGDPAHYQIVQEGMRLSVSEGTSIGLSVPYVHIAGKTGTAELGTAKSYVNSWTAGFFPYEAPRYAYVIVMEKGPVKNLVGATSVMRQVADWMNVNTPEYFK